MVNRKYEIALLLLVQFCISVLLSLIIESSNGMNLTFRRLPYFVIKDDNGRFGEFHSFMTNKTMSIDLELWAYNIRKLSEQ